MKTSGYTRHRRVGMIAKQARPRRNERGELAAPNAAMRPAAPWSLTPATSQPGLRHDDRARAGHTRWRLARPRGQAQDGAAGPDELAVRAHPVESRMRQTCSGHLGPELPAELAAHPDDSEAYEDWKAWRQRRRNWFLEHGLTYDFVEDLQLRRYVRGSGGTWIQTEPGRSRWVLADRQRSSEVGESVPVARPASE